MFKGKTLMRKRLLLFLFQVILGGEYAGCLLVNRHRYFLGGGSYDWVWLLTADGKEIGPVSDGSEEGVKMFKEMYVK